MSTKYSSLHATENQQDMAIQCKAEVEFQESAELQSCAAQNKPIAGHSTPCQAGQILLLMNCSPMWWDFKIQYKLSARQKFQAKSTLPILLRLHPLSAETRYIKAPITSTMSFLNTEHFQLYNSKSPAEG